MNAATQKWREQGLDVALDNLGFPGDRNDAATYLEDRGWQPVRTPLNQLLADNGLPLQSERPRSAVRQELLLHRGVAQDRLTKGRADAEQQAPQAT